MQAMSRLGTQASFIKRHIQAIFTAKIRARCALKFGDRFFRNGSTTDSGGYPQFRPLLGAKRKSISEGWMSVHSQEEKLVGVSETRVLSNLITTLDQYLQISWG